MKKALTIAGSDTCGGAGIQADLKTFSAHGVYGMSVITAVTAQNTQGVFGVLDVTVDIIEKQIDAIFDDIDVDAVKIGMVSQTDTIKTIASTLKKYSTKNIVLDPVMISKSGYDLLKPEAKEALISELIPLATIITPNAPEAEVITGIKIESIQDMEEAAKKIYDLGVENVLVKGGHLSLESKEAIDVLYNGQDFRYYKSPIIETKNTHGTGCTLSSAIASNLALGNNIERSVELAKSYITIAIENSFSIGKGVGPTHHFYELYKKAGLLSE
ncbi:hydroxymethylpyrimidine/phosphomethylpyrimidine kinase [Natranaerovirga pectinivora]|uniref:Hydroxymethylpyrimidine/phosphomethylpyrimidine kinase n=1 Tax=Natranaerovirga pectinivora TaxID=682400 RepID=A0A4R3MNY1_9FIRM|nr:bifunctional hydroxymethylpyrimidine kinase/phosphomethylpyrimidine kinase [Natranaerovirga pectinivora]TCT16260.1 hydroxymethylpyrimidine/phosphomethylpyrimidine kinase [Natranaerovirga pectinivora]